MSDRDRRVTGRSNEQVRSIAERTKAEYRVSRRRPVNILKCLESGFVPTIYGRKKLVFRVVDDAELGEEYARTEFAKDQITITARRTIRDNARFGDGHARMTLAHELAHAVMHGGAALFRLITAVGKSNLADEAGYESAEHQAKVFAAAFLIHEEDALLMQSAEEIATEFGVSLAAAEIEFKRLQAKRDRAASSERVNRIAEEVRRTLTKKANADPKSLSYLPDLCGSCHSATLIPIGTSKVLCDTCKFVGDRFQDGDQAGG
jgi:hypothetical protein